MSSVSAYVNRSFAQGLNVTLSPFSAGEDSAWSFLRIKLGSGHGWGDTSFVSKVRSFAPTSNPFQENY